MCIRDRLNTSVKKEPILPAPKINILIGLLIYDFHLLPYAFFVDANQAMVQVIVTQEKMPITSAFTIGEYVDMDKGVQIGRAHV